MEIKNLSKESIEALHKRFNISEKEMRDIIDVSSTDILFYTNFCMRRIEKYNNSQMHKAVKNSINMSIVASMLDIMKKDISKKELKEFLKDALNDDSEEYKFKVVEIDKT